MQNTSDHAMTNSTRNSLDTLLPEVVNYDPAQFAELREGGLFGEFQNYRLVRKLGEGGMGQTWLAVKMSDGKDVQRVVCKILSDKLREDENAMAEVRRIFDLTYDWTHPNICPLLGLETDPVFGIYLVMAYIEGDTLAQWFHSQPLRKKGLSLDTVRPIIRPLAEALDHAHAAGVLHRDVKPQNIILTNRRKPVLLDFGIAARIRPENISAETCTLGRSVSLSEKPGSSGTPLYMAPEQMESGRQNGRTDQYALATILYELLAGSLPFQEENFVALRREKSTFSPNLPSLSRHQNQVLARALADNSKDRFPTCSKFLEALDHKPAPCPASFKIAGALTVLISGGALLINSCTMQKKLETAQQALAAAVADTRAEEQKAAQAEIARARSEAQSANERAVKAEGEKTQALTELQKAVEERNGPVEAAKMELRRQYAVLERALSGNFEFTSLGDRVQLTQYIGKADSVELPLGVTVIGPKTFSRQNKLLSVTLPDTLETIEVGAFYSCDRLNTINFPSNLRIIGEDAFSGCESLKSAVLPASLQKIGPKAFYHCNSLTSVTIYSKSVEISEDAFDGMDERIHFHGPTGSTIEHFARRKGFKFTPLPNAK